MTNLDLIKIMAAEELASMLQIISKSESREYIDWNKWLAAEDPELIPGGTQVLADILTRTADGTIVDRRETVPCIILADNIKISGIKYYRIYEIDRKRIIVIPQSQVEVIYT